MLMTSTLNQRGLQAFAWISPHDASALLATADTLQRAALAGTTQPLLRGKNVGMLSEIDDDDTALFRSAAAELGARVAHVRPSLSELSRLHDVQHTARVLGRLYDAVECQGMATALVQQLGQDAGVPVYDGLATLQHPTARLAELLGGDAGLVVKRRFVVQAVLLSALA